MRRGKAQFAVVKNRKLQIFGKVTRFRYTQLDAITGVFRENRAKVAPQNPRLPLVHYTIY